MAHRNKFNRVGVKGGFVCGAFSDKVVVDGEMRRQFGCGHHGLVGHDFVVGAVVEYADDRAIPHRAAGEVAHALLSAFAVEPAAFEIWQSSTDSNRLADSRELKHTVVDMLAYVHGDVATVAFSPSFRPKIACNFRDFIDLSG